VTVAEAHLHAFLSALGPVPGKREDFLSALAHEPPANLDRLYWLARVTLVSRLEDIPYFDAVFAAYFGGGTLPREVPADETGEAEAPPSGEGELGALEWAEGSGQDASPLDLRHERRFEPCGERSIAAALPRVRARRLRPAKRGQLDLRRTLRDNRLRWRAKPSRVRPVLVLIDVSGSQREHSPEYLRFARSVLDACDRAEAFTFGTRLQRVTAELRRGELEVADADGGTNIGASLQTFLRRHVHLARGALVIVLSDGLERGDPRTMARSVERLSRLAHRVVWWTPLAADPTYQPVTRGLRAVLPSLDQLAGAHDLETRINDVGRVCAGPRRQAERDWQ
jgi:uncharacterized protein with von Willebrand factor type A (vWA) domain